MATVLNAFNLISSGGNTGVGQRAIDIKNIVGAILLPAGTKIAASNMATAAGFLTYLQGQTLAAKAARFYPIKGFEEVTDGSEKPSVQTLGYGSRAVAREGYFDWTFQIIRGGLFLATALRKFNSMNMDVLFVDSSNVIFGKKDSAGNLYGIPQAYVYQAPFKINDGSKASVYAQQFVFKPDFVDSLGFVQLNPNDFDNINGLQDVVLTSGGARVTNVSLVKANYAYYGGIDLHTLYASTLASASLWSVTDSVSGNAIAITSVADNPTIGGWTITVSATDPNYVAGNPVNISMASPATLNTAGVTSVESNVLTTPN